MAAAMMSTQETDYDDWSASVKSRNHAARMKIALSATSEVIALIVATGCCHIGLRTLDRRG